MEQVHIGMGLIGGLLIAMAVPSFAAEAPARGCADVAAFSEQNFVLGDWDVYHGESHIAAVRLEKVMDGCAIAQTWAPGISGGINGTGLFTYSAASGRWHYLWAGDDQGSTAFIGALQATGNMRYETALIRKDGSVRQRHWSLILEPDGRILERAVGSDDGGKTWAGEYDLYWVRKGRGR